MGYIVKIKSYKEIKENDIDAIVHSLPDYLRGPFNEIKKQAWGWPCACDINLPKGNEVMISGAYSISGKKAEDFCKYIQTELDKKGYDTSIFYTEGVLFDQEITKDTEKIKLNPEVNVDIPEVKLKDDYIDAATRSIQAFGENALTAFKDVTESMVKAGKFINKDNCSHCGKKIDLSIPETHYCEKCYQLLIVKNSKLQIEIKNRIPTEDVQMFMLQLKDILTKKESARYQSPEKLKDIMELYLKNIDKLGGIKYESYD